MKNDKYLLFDIQMFAEDLADNTLDEEEPAGVSLDGDATDAGSDDGDKVDEPIDKTKAFSERLKNKTKEIESKYDKMFNDKLDNVAKINGFNSWSEMEKAQNKNALIDAGVDDFDKFEDVLNRMINQNPDVIEAKKIVERNKQIEQDKIVQEDISKISQYDASIKSLDDISKLDNCQEIIDKVKAGYSLYDAYVLANFDTIKTNFKEAGKTSAINNIDSKSHMKTATGGTSKDVNIPQDVLEMYRKNLRGWTDKQIKEHYIKTNK